MPTPPNSKRLGLRRSFDVLGDYRDYGDPFDNHPLSGGDLKPNRPGIPETPPS